MGSLTITIGLKYQREGGPLQPTRELVALGLANAGGCIFGGVVPNGSLSRSTLASSLESPIGGLSQLYNVAVAATLMFVILWLAPCLESIPVVVLAAILLVALEPLFSRISADCTRLRGPEGSRADLAVWAVTLAATVLTDVSWGCAPPYRPPLRPRPSPLQPVGRPRRLWHFPASAPAPQPHRSRRAPRP